MRESMSSWEACASVTSSRGGRSQEPGSCCCVALLESADGLFKEVTEIAEKYLGRIDRSKVASIAYWNAKRKADVEGGGGTALGK